MSSTTNPLLLDTDGPSSSPSEEDIDDLTRLFPDPHTFIIVVTERAAARNVSILEELLRLQMPLSFTVADLRAKISNDHPEHPPANRQQLKHGGEAVQNDEDTLHDLFFDVNGQPHAAGPLLFLDIISNEAADTLVPSTDVPGLPVATDQQVSSLPPQHRQDHENLVASDADQLIEFRILYVAPGWLSGRRLNLQMPRSSTIAEVRAALTTHPDVHPAAGLQLLGNDTATLDEIFAHPYCGPTVLVLEIRTTVPDTELDAADLANDGRDPVVERPAWSSVDAVNLAVMFLTPVALALLVRRYFGLRN